MTPYADGFVIPVPEQKLEAYREMAEQAAAVWREHGALDYKECVLDDAVTQCGPGFAQGIAARPGETVIFSWILYASREHRDAVNAKVMADPRIQAMCPAQAGNETPFDVERMLYGGFRVIIDTATAVESR